MPHADIGEAALAILVGKEAGPNIDQIQAPMKRDVVRFKHPRAFIVIDELPRNAMEKVQKNVLRETYANWFISNSV